MAIIPVPQALGNKIINLIRQDPECEAFAQAFADAATGKSNARDDNTWHRAYVNGFAKIAANVSGRMMGAP